MNIWGAAREQERNTWDLTLGDTGATWHYNLTERWNRSGQTDEKERFVHEHLSLHFLLTAAYYKSDVQWVPDPSGNGVRGRGTLCTGHQMAHTSTHTHTVHPHTHTQRHLSLQTDA